MTVIEHFKMTENEVREPVHFVLSKTGKATNCVHNHDVPTVDDFKRSRGMLETAAKYVSKGFKAADVFRALRAEDQPEIHQLFLNAGGGCDDSQQAWQPEAAWARWANRAHSGGLRRDCPPTSPRRHGHVDPLVR